MQFAAFIDSCADLVEDVDIGSARSTHGVRRAEWLAADSQSDDELEQDMRWMLIMNVEPAAAARAAEELDLAQVVAVMGAYNEELQKAGVFLSAEGLSDASEGFRVDFSSQPPVVTDGPYAEAREIFTGYWILEVASREEAEHWARKCPLGPGTALEVRRVNEFADIDLSTEDPAVGEWVEKAQEWRAANA